MRSIRLACACAVLLAAGTSPAYGQSAYDVVDIGSLGGNRTEAWDMNESGQVSGEANTAQSANLTAFFWDGTTLHAIGPAGAAYSVGRTLNDAGQVAVDARGKGYRWTAGTLEPIGPPGVATSAADIDSAGNVAGTYVLPNGHIHAYRWSGGALQDLGTLGGSYSAPSAMNDAGQIAGAAMAPGEFLRYPVIWTDGVLRNLGLPPGTTDGNLEVLNANGQGAGTARASGWPRPIRWDGSQLQELGYLDGPFATVSAINARGQVVGNVWYGDWSGRGTRAVLWNDTTPLELVPGSDGTWAADVNDAGVVVGTAGGGDQYAFVWDGTLRRLDDLVAADDPLKGRVRVKWAGRINEAGQILAGGYYPEMGTDPAVLRTFVLTPRRAYAFGGFQRPIESAPAVNVRQAGAAVPVKFGLGGYRGANPFAPGYPRTVQCTTGTTAPTTAAGHGDVQYDPRGDSYTYVWKTDPAWAGTCRRLEVAFTDGATTAYATFQFR